jgi:hypothetical protein
LPGATGSTPDLASAPFAFQGLAQQGVEAGGAWAVVAGLAQQYVAQVLKRLTAPRGQGREQEAGNSPPVAERGAGQVL